MMQILHWGTDFVAGLMIYLVVGPLVFWGFVIWESGVNLLGWLMSQDYSPEHADEDVEAIEWAARKVADFGKSTIKFLGRSA